MSSPSRTAILNKIHKVLKKHYKPVAPPAGRTLLEHLVYACCLEDARPEAADEAFAKLLPPCFIDWNEVRVTSKTELSEEVTNKLPDPMTSAAHIKHALQGVFESQFAFDIEHLKKQNLGKSEKDLEGFAGGSHFIQSYVIQHGLGGHSIPCSHSVLDVFYALGVISESEHEKRVVPGLERAIPKSKGVEFGSLIHQLAADYHASPQSPRVRAILVEIDPDSKDRLPKRHTARREVGKELGRKPALPVGIPLPDPNAKKPSRPDAKGDDKAPAKNTGAKAKEGKGDSARDDGDSKSGGAPKLAKKKPR